MNYRRKLETFLHKVLKQGGWECVSLLQKILPGTYTKQKTL